jgi:hypothetical protein
VLTGRTFIPPPSTEESVHPQRQRQAVGLLGDPELTLRSKINCLGYGAPVRNHRSVKLGDGLTTGFDEQEGEDGVDKTRAGPHEHLPAEPGSSKQVTPVGFPN